MWRVVPGVLISLIALGAIFYFVDINEVKSAFQGANYRYLVPVVLVYATGLAVRAKAWRTLLRDEVDFKNVFLTLNAGYLLNNILPLRLGEFGRAFLLGRKGLGFWRVFTTILIERAFDMTIVAGLVLGTLPLVWGAPQARFAAGIILSIVLLGLLALHLLARNQDRAVYLLEKLVDQWPLLNRLGKNRIQNFFAGLVVLTEFSRFLKVLGWMLMAWVFAILAQYWLLIAFVPRAELLWVIFGQGVVALGVALPSSPAYVGVLEAAWVSALTLVGVQPSVALAYAFASHLLNIVVTGLFGSIALLREGLSVSGLYHRIRQETSQS